MKNLTEAFEILLKARKMDVGTITTRRGGRQYQKQADGTWAEYRAGGKTKAPANNAGEDASQVKKTDLQGNPKEAFMYSMEEYKAGQPPVKNGQPVKLDIGEFHVVKERNLSGGGGDWFTIHEPYHGLEVAIGNTLERAIQFANENFEKHNTTSMQQVKELVEEVAKKNQRIAITNADIDSLFSKAISEGKMTYQDAIKILKSAGIKKPKDKNLDDYNPKAKKKKEQPYEKAYKNVKVNTSSSMSRQDINKYMAVAGLPEGFDGEVEIREKGTSLIIETNNSPDIYMKRIITTGGIDEGIIKNDTLRIYNTNKYKGTDVFYNQVKNAQKEGFNKIETQAYRGYDWNGYYTWLRLGYKPNDGEDDMFVEEANDALGTNISSITELMYSQEGRDYWKANGDSFYANFDLSENSYSMETLEEYVKNKNK